MDKSKSKSRTKKNNIFENSYTKLYNKVEEFNVPVRYIIYEIVDGEENYESLKNIYLKTPDENLLEIYNKYGTKISFKEFICSYFSFIVEKNGGLAEQTFVKINETIDLLNQQRKEEEKEFIVFSKYDSLNKFFNDVKEWYKNYDKELTRDIKKRNKITNIIQYLVNTTPVYINKDEINFEKMTHEFIPNIEIEREGRLKTPLKVDSKIGILVFNGMVCSQNIPYIQLNNYDGTKYFKVFDADIMKDIGKLIEQEYIDNDKTNTFYFKVLLPGEEKMFKTEERDFIKKSSYVDCIYNLDKNRLKFITEMKQREDIVNKLNNCYKYFDIFEPKREYNIQGNFVVKNFKLNPAVLHFLVFNEAEIEEILGLSGLINTYFFINESEKTTAEKEFIELKFKTLSDNDEDEPTTSLYPSSLTAKITQDGDDLIVRMTKIMSFNVLDQFIAVFGRFLTIYKDSEESILNFLNEFFEDDIEETTTVVKKDKMTEKKVKQLRESFAKITGSEEQGDLLFNPGTTGYTRICECKKQPIIVTTEKDADDWESRTFNYKNEILTRQIGAFPPDEPKFSFVCPEDEYPFPSVAKNNDPVSSKIYPYVPCCAKTDEINNPNSNYNNYKNVKVEKENPNKGYNLNTMKSLDYGRTGEIPKLIQSLLDSKDEENKKFKYQRMGMGLSTNSLIHCVLRALQVEDYMSLENQKDKEKYCLFLRRNIQKYIPNFYELIKQENYNYSKEYVRRRLVDGRDYFNSAFYYRILEELFNVNIYIILYKEKLYGKDSKTEEPGIEIPNHSKIHIRPLRLDRPTVVIIKHMGGEMEGLKFPQYDLIFKTGILLNSEAKALAQESRSYVFGDDMTQLMHDTVINYNKNIVFNITDNKIEAREYPYSRIFWPSVFDKFIIESQNIDLYGKARSLNVAVPNTDIKFTVYIPPSQPINVPMSNIVYETTYEIATSIFGTPSKEINTGLWYKVLDYEYGLFIVCKTDSVETYPESPVPLNITNGNSSIINFRNVKKYTKMLIDCIIWGLRSNGILNLEDYLNNYNKFIFVNENVRPNILPAKNRSYITENGNFMYLSNIWPEYFYKNNTVQLYPELYDKIIRYLANYYKNNDGLSTPPNPYLTDIFIYEWDFDTKEQTRILIGEEHLKQWFQIKEKSTNGELEIHNVLLMDNINSNLETPFIYEYDESLYLIQTVQDGNFIRALNCGNEWNKTKYNTGYKSSPVKSKEIIPYIVYNISNNHKIFLEKQEDDKTYGLEPYVSLIKLEDKYIAMLPL